MNADWHIAARHILMNPLRRRRKMSTGVTIAMMIVVAITAGLWLAIMTWPAWVIVNVTTRDRS